MPPRDTYVRTSKLATFGGGPLYVLSLLICVRRLLVRQAKVKRAGAISPTMPAITLALFALSASLMDAIGIHAIFGGFILGVMMPSGPFSAELKRQLEPVTVMLLLPIFFTYSRFNTRLDTVNSPSLLLVAFGIGAR